MTTPVLLLILRIGGAVLLLAFFAAIGWYLRQDLRATRRAMTGQGPSLGVLRVIANTGEQPAPDTVYELSPITTLGRNSRNTIVLTDGYVSGEHALLAWRDSQWWLEDLGSRNGTVLNDAPLSDPTVISTGDVLTIGGVQLKLELPGRREAGNGSEDATE